MRLNTFFLSASRDLSFSHNAGRQKKAPERPVFALFFVTFIHCLIYRTKFAQQAGSPLSASLEPCTPTKPGPRSGSKGTPDPQAPCPEPLKVTFSLELDLLAELYYTCISGKQPPGGIKTLKQKCNTFFATHILLLSCRKSGPKYFPGAFLCDPATDFSVYSCLWRSIGKIMCRHFRFEPSSCMIGVTLNYHEMLFRVKLFLIAFSDVLERCYLRQVHNCVYFAVKLLESQFQWVLFLFDILFDIICLQPYLFTCSLSFN